ncbi:trypsin-like peptidase domain-containing protein [Salmonella enterica]|nr:trypsin-like peptidase domain-containing protein [Salmonella enterica]EGN7527263.1 trypsin-like peptidase domain-containing protein [Salmonella enterica]EGO6832883.1 trypsin-like peptidase domain-containing protein [Salmonella enterica]EGO6840270.1 trypsin-like peptidase domain-containing protein [Salmonella enterica]EGO6860199.1 trypsin-like peptidase domain-containing protein [Salmonella enterica]
MKIPLLVLSLSAALTVQGAISLHAEHQTFRNLKNGEPTLYETRIEVEQKAKNKALSPASYSYHENMTLAIQKALRSTVLIEELYTNEPRTLFTIPSERETVSRRLYTPILERLSLIATTPKVGEALSQGSGFVIEPGYVLTARHVVDRKGRYQVTVPTGEKYEAKIVAYSQQHDIALLQIADSKTPALPLSWTLPAAGEALASVGYPGGRDLVVKQGVASAVRETLAYDNLGRVNVIEATGLNLDHGHSGGPVINAAGEVVGIAAYVYDKYDFSTSAAEGYESLIPAKGMCSI